MKMLPVPGVRCKPTIPDGVAEVFSRDQQRQASLRRAWCVAGFRYWQQRRARQAKARCYLRQNCFKNKGRPARDIYVYVLYIRQEYGGQEEWQQSASFSILADTLATVDSAKAAKHLATSIL